MRTLLPQFVNRVKEDFYNTHNNIRPLRKSGSRAGFKLVDLGCGTGRNTLQLLAAAPQDADIVGLDASTGMLDVARKAIERGFQSQVQASLSTSRNWKDRVRLETYDLLKLPSSSRQSLCAAAQDALGIISTLVLEHIPLDIFFANATALLRPGGYLLVTNMHADMGARSQAGFVDPVTGKKIRPTSYAHTLPDVLDAAAQAGFQVVTLDGDNAEHVRERTVTKEMADVLGPRAKKWVGVAVWFGVCFRKSEV